MEYVIENLTDMQAFAADFMEHLTVQTDGATILALQGDLGAGKTTFTQGIAQALAVDETVNSPTFVIEKIYALDGQKWQRLIHIDAYRLESAHELEVLGWKEIIADPDNLIIIEWPERVAKALPPSALTLEFEWKTETERVVHTDGITHAQ